MAFHTSEFNKGYVDCVNHIYARGREGEETNNTINTDSNANAEATAINNKNNDKNDISREAIFNMAAGLWVSKTLATALELQVFSKLSGNKSVTLNELQKLLGMECRPMCVWSHFIAFLPVYFRDMTQSPLFIR